MPNGHSFRTLNRAAPYLLVLLTMALAFYGLGRKALWGDEIAQAVWSAWDWTNLWQQFRAPPDFILHFVFVHLAQEVGAGEFFVRLPSAVTALLCVPLVYVLARRLGRGPALVAMALLAVAPYQVWYAQEARMYAGLECWALVSLYFFVRLLPPVSPSSAVVSTSRTREKTLGAADEISHKFTLRNRRARNDSAANERINSLLREGLLATAGLTVGNTLALYTHLFGVFPLLSEVVIAGGLVIAASVQAKRVRLPYWVGWFAASVVVTVLLAIPLAPGTLPYILEGARPAVAASVAPSLPFQFTPAFLWELVQDFGLGAGEFWRSAISLVLALAGFVVLAVTRPRAAWIAMVWLALPLLVLAVTQPKHSVAARYLIFLQPVWLCLMAQGIWTAGRASIERFPSLRNNPRVVAAAVLVGVVTIVAMVASPLASLYARAKLNDWRAIARYLEQHAEPGDLVLGERNTPNMNALTYYLPNLLRYSTPPTTPELMQAAIAQNRRVWYISVGDYFDREGDRLAREILSPVPAEAWREPGLVYKPGDGFLFAQSEPPATIFRHDGQIPNKIEYAGRQGFAREGNTNVHVNPGEILEAILRLESDTPRMVKIQFSSKQPADFQVFVDGAPIGQVRDDAQNKGGRVIDLALAPGTGSIVRLTVKNEGEYPLFVRSLELAGGP